MATTKTKRKCGSCGGHCGGRRGSCKFAANEAKRRADELWAHAKATVSPRRAPAQEPGEQNGGAAQLTRCAAGRDGECGHAQCPQLRDDEPTATGRHCPLDDRDEG